MCNTGDFTLSIDTISLMHTAWTSTSNRSWNIWEYKLFTCFCSYIPIYILKYVHLRPVMRAFHNYITRNTNRAHVYVLVVTYYVQRRRDCVSRQRHTRRRRSLIHLRCFVLYQNAPPAHIPYFVSRDSLKCAGHVCHFFADSRPGHNANVFTILSTCRRVSST